MLKLTLVLLAAAVAAQPGFAQETGSGTSERPAQQDKKDEKKDKEEKDPSITHHEVTIGGKLIKYTATAGCMEQPDYDGKPKANIFYTSYVKDAEGGGDAKAAAAKRPILFAFNGGPGSSSVWLHLGALGPRRVEFADPGEKPGEPSLPRPPYRVVDNEYAWLDLADIVFIDPVSTGYSRPVEGESAKQFHGLDEDIRWVGDFIRLWTTRNQRWDSPKFLAGESYGTTRAAGLSGYLQDTHGMYLSGIILISPVLDFQTIAFNGNNDTPYWLFLPTYTATAWYHGKLGPDLQRQPLERVLAEVQDWAGSTYLVALGRGSALADKERGEVADRLARYTGLSRRYVEDSRLRINIHNFCKELLRDQDRTVGRLDSRYRGIDRDGVSASPDYDPSYAAIQGPFTAALNSYVRSELLYENDNAYEILTGRVQPWSYASATNRYAEVANTLRGAMSKNKDLKVLVASGYYDLATPHFAAAYTIEHLGLDPALRGNISQTFYQCGHMMYIRHEDLAKLKADAGRFIEDALGE